LLFTGKSFLVFLFMYQSDAILMPQKIKTLIPSGVYCICSR
jgi:hypothetical protein